MNQTKKAMLMMLLTAFLWSLAGVFIKLIEMDALAIVCMRSFAASLTMLFFIRRQKLPWSWPMLGGALSYMAFTYCIILSTKLTTSATAVMMQYTAPIYVAFFSWMILNERVRRSDWVVSSRGAGAACAFSFWIKWAAAVFLETSLRWAMASPSPFSPSFYASKKADTLSNPSSWAAFSPFLSAFPSLSGPFSLNFPPPVTSLFL